MRLFFGLPWPEEQREDLVRRTKVWAGRPALRPVKPENWHVTLRFLGDTAEDQVPSLVTLMETWSKRRGALTFVDRGWGCFGSHEAPRVVTLALEALPEGRRAVETFHKALDASTFAGDGKVWKPHVTVAYGRGENPGPWPEEVLGGRPPVIFPRVVLYESELGPGGSLYRELASVKL
jgi:2'-5' RNA ligase